MISKAPAELNMQYKYFVGENCIVEFLEELEKDARLIYQWTSHGGFNIPMKKVGNFLQLKKSTRYCKCCQMVFAKESDKFADHNHYNGEFRVIVCKTCNDNMRVNRKYCQLFSIISKITPLIVCVLAGLVK